MATKEREKHMQKYPMWSARDNYGINKKKKQRKVPRSSSPEISKS